MSLYDEGARSRTRRACTAIIYDGRSVASVHLPCSDLFGAGSATVKFIAPHTTHALKGISLNAQPCRIFVFVVEQMQLVNEYSIMDNRTIGSNSFVEFFHGFFTN